MKRNIVLVVLMAFVMALLPAAPGNMQKIYPVDDPIFEDVRTLYILSGLSLPSTTGPWSGAELSSMMEKVDPAALSETARGIYDRVNDTLVSDSLDKTFEFKGSFNIEGYLNTSDEERFTGWDNWHWMWADSKPLISIVGEQHPGLNFYGYFDFNVRTAKTHSPLEGEQVGDGVLWTNIPFLMQNDMKQLDFNFPFRAFVAAGGDDWNLLVGRDRISWGPGRTGNFLIGDHIKYHNAARVSVFEDNFKYTFQLLGFYHPQNYYFGGALHPTGEDGQSSYLNGISMFMAHRLEWRLFSDRLGINLTEGVMYMSKDNRFDLIALSPAHLWHNSYTRALTNSILGFELDWTPMKALNLYSSFVIDESVLPGEPVPGKEGDSKAEPTAMGFMLGATYGLEAGPGVLTFNLEGALTDPYLYLRDGDYQIDENGYRNQNKGEYGINYVVATREMIGAGGTQFFDEQFLGYRYGGDAIVADFRIDYNSLLDFRAGLDLFYMAHGTHDRWTVWTRVNEGIPNSTVPTDTHVSENHKDPDAKDRDAVEHTIAVSLDGRWDIKYGFGVYGELCFLTVINPGNISTAGTLFDLQTVIGVSWAW